MTESVPKAQKTELELLSLGELAGTAVQRAIEALVQHDDAKAQGDRRRR